MSAALCGSGRPASAPGSIPDPPSRFRRATPVGSTPRDIVPAGRLCGGSGLQVSVPQQPQQSARDLAPEVGRGDCARSSEVEPEGVSPTKWRAMHQQSPGASLSPTPNRTPRSSKTNVFAPHSSANTPTLRSARASRESIKSSGAESEGEVRELLAPLHLRLAVLPEGSNPTPAPTPTP